MTILPLRKIISPKVFALFAVCLFLQGCVTGTVIPTTIPTTPGEIWYAPYLQKHPLVGRIWSTEKKYFVTSDHVIEDAMKNDFVLLGELHDNIDHHQLQAWMVAELYKRGKLAGLTMEMIPEDRQKSLDAYLSIDGGTAEGLSSVLNLQKEGWKNWRMYYPIVEAALTARVPIQAGSFSKKQIMSIVRNGYDTLDLRERFEMHLDEPVDDKTYELVKESIRVSHMGALPQVLEDKMTNMQIAKDARMALNMVKLSNTSISDGAILIAGKGHARTDIGVPYHIKRIFNSTNVVSIGFFEVEDGITDPHEYHELFKGSDDLPFDYVWFTPQQKNTSNTAGNLKKIEKAVKKHNEDD